MLLFWITNVFFQVLLNHTYALFLYFLTDFPRNVYQLAIRYLTISPRWRPLLIHFMPFYMLSCVFACSALWPSTTSNPSMTIGRWTLLRGCDRLWMMITLNPLFVSWYANVWRWLANWSLWRATWNAPRRKLNLAKGIWFFKLTLF